LSIVAVAAEAVAVVVVAALAIVLLLWLKVVYFEKSPTVERERARE